MTLAMNSADPSESPVDSLLDRLCRIDTDVVYFPVRHHSPAAAVLVGQLIASLQPKAVLIEGPSDFNDRLDELLLDHQLPIAIYSYFRRTQPAGDNTAITHRGAYYPFCDYSPEWVAMRAAANLGMVVRFIDLPWRAVERHDQVTQRYADAELRRSRYVANLCERMHVEDFDDLWDKIVESQSSLTVEEYLRRVHSLCFHIRLWEENIRRTDIEREAFMADQIRAVRESTDGPILVMTGGFHSSALAARLEAFDCPGISDDAVLPVDDVAANNPDDSLLEAGLALTTYSYERLDSLVGYNAGMPSPGFYDTAWQQRIAGEGFSHVPLLILLVEELRRRKQTLSTADLIAIETTARALASLRGSAHVWRRDLLDAVTSALIKDELQYGCSSPFVDATHAVLRGNRRGRLAEGTRMPPLVLDIRTQLEESQLQATLTPREVEFDLLNPGDLKKSRLLHRLSALGIAGYKRIDGTDFLVRESLDRLWERWRLAWSPEFESSCIEASRYGTSLTDAVAARFTEIAQSLDRNAAAAAELIVQAALAGVDTISEPLLDRLNELIHQESQFTGTTRALRHLLFLYCFDEAFGTTRLDQVGQLVTEAFSRSQWLLESLGRSPGDARQQIDGLRTLLETLQRAATTLNLNQTEFVEVVTRVKRDSQQNPALRGAAAGVLWTLGSANDAEILADLKQFSSPSDLGDFLAGLFAVSRELAQRDPRLLRTIDQRLMEFDADHFQMSLPALRLAFTYFTPREKHFMLTTLFESLGLKRTTPLAALSVDAETAAEALAFEERLFELIDKFHLEPIND